MRTTGIDEARLLRASWTRDGFSSIFIVRAELCMKDPILTADSIKRRELDGTVEMQET